MAAPNKIKQEDKLPNKKYFKPAEVADNLFLFKVAKIYKLKDCNSIHKYIERRYKLDINKTPPNILNKAIKEY